MDLRDILRDGIYDARRERQFAPKTNPKELLKLFRILYKNKPRFRDGQFTQVGDVIDFVIDENGHRTGKVVEATHSVFGEVVVKMCRVTPMTPNKPLERLRREVLFLRRMHNCNHIVQVLGSTCATEGKVDRRHLVTIVFEKMTDGTIEQALEALPKSERRMPEEQVLYMARDILTGLHIMHTTNDVDCPSLHLDIKPANIGIITNDRGEKIYKLLNFELTIQQNWSGKGSKIGGKTLLRLTDAKSPFMSPELYTADEFQTIIGPESDLWSLAVTMYYCLTGNYPFTADATGTAESMRISILNDQPRHILEAAEACSATISSHTGNIVMQGLQKNINDRFPSAKAMLDTVLAAIELLRENLGVRFTGHDHPIEDGAIGAISDITMQENVVGGGGDPAGAPTTIPMNPWTDNGLGSTGNYYNSNVWGMNDGLDPLYATQSHMHEQNNVFGGGFMTPSFFGGMLSGAGAVSPPGLPIPSQAMDSTLLPPSLPGGGNSYSTLSGSPGSMYDPAPSMA